MVRLTRRTFVQVTATAAIGLAPVAIVRSARAQSYTYKFGHSFPLTHPVHIFLASASDRIRKGTDGALTIEVMGAAQLGGDSHMLSQIRSGSLEFYVTGGTLLSTVFPVAAIVGTGFAFQNYAAVWKAMDGDLGRLVNGAISRVGLHAFDTIWDNGFRVVSTTARPIRELADFKGLKLRVPVSPILIAMFRALGASPVGMNASEVYAALQTRVLDGQENALLVFDAWKLYEIQRHVALTSHAWEGSWILANAHMWRALPGDIRAVVSRCFDEEGIKQRADIEAKAGALREGLTGKDVSFTVPDVASLRSALREAGYYAELKQKFGPEAWSVLSRYSNDLG